MAKSTKWVYFFGARKAEGDGKMKQLLGGKGAGLAEMTRIGLPVPAGFTITTEACAAFSQRAKKWPTGLEEQVKQNLKKLERTCKKRFGDRKHPLLLSVRSGAAISMPGMMETILNLGLNDESVEGLAKASNNRRFALDAYRRFIMMYGSTAMGVSRELFDEAFDEIKEQRTRQRINKPHGETVLDTEVNESELEHLIGDFKRIYSEKTGEKFPQDPYQQLKGAINAVFDSWMAEKAVTYRRVEKITGLAGTGVNVMQMVFGNMGDDSGTGVCFTRDPSTGVNEFYGDLLLNAQGEDVVAGVRTPVKLFELQSILPEVYQQLEAVRCMLEVHYQDMQDLEFTFEQGKLYMLQCRTGKRSPTAAFRIAYDQATKPVIPPAEVKRLVRKKYLPQAYATRAAKPVITKEQAIARIKDVDIERLFYPIIDPAISKNELSDRCLGAGINAVPGAAGGEIVFTAAEAEERAKGGTKVILVRRETSPEDVGGMHAAQGILTATGGKTSHAAVVARGWGKCCIVGCDALRIDYKAGTMALNGKTLRQGDWITLDGTSGDIYDGRMSLVPPTEPEEYSHIMRWCDDVRRLKVRTNADTPKDAAKAIELGAEGIGLCRTEHMFFETEARRLAMQEMIVADSEATRRAALDKLLPFQRGDFEGIFEAMNGLPVTIRLVDPPLHEFLPQTDADRKRLAEHAGVSEEFIRQRGEQLHESNPMLGHRGCRLCITYPEILEMQVRAIIEAAINCTNRGVKVLPEIMIPLSIDPKELSILTERTRALADAILDEAGVQLNYMVGTMVETPRAALLGDKIAEVAQFFSFGTNDLTQTTMGLSRDDAGRFLPEYIDEAKTGIFPDDPFQVLDQDGVGMLVKWAIERGRSARPKLKIGICGEHGGELKSVKFCHGAGMDYVSCSPYRVPIARLAAAQAVIEERGGEKASKGGRKSAAKAKKTTAKKATTRSAATKSKKTKTSKKTKASKKTAKAKKAKKTKKRK
ncbi:MAG TPA: PEP/pyruvate-binding domain-containing protein [Phycisphaerae bacterium]|nr:pyruvate, phosphate dikinase [Phycisphaerales bacterium]HRX83677.1 PEP/pyruvate-binding domain-containing protein [Phycisphaerae bacterium]